MVISGAGSFGVREFPAPHRSWVIGAVPFNRQRSPAVLRSFLAEAEAAGCDAIKIPHCYPEEFFAGASRPLAGARGGELDAPPGQSRWPGLAVEDLRRFARECASRVALVVAVYDQTALADVAGLSNEVAMLSVEVPVATNLRLVDGVAETGHAALVEVNLLSPEQIKSLCQRFAPGQLTLVWRQGLARPTPAGTVEALFTLVRLQQYGCPIGYAGSVRDPLAPLIAVGFGSVVVEEPLSGNAPELRELVSRVRTCQAAQTELEAEAVSPDELDAADELRPSLLAAHPIGRGEVITPNMVVVKAPFRGLSPALLPLVLGRRALYDIAQGEPITFGLIDL